MESYYRWRHTKMPNDYKEKLVCVVSNSYGLEDPFHMVTTLPMESDDDIKVLGWKYLEPMPIGDDNL